VTPSAGSATQVSAHAPRRRYPRYPMRSLAYVRLEHNNGGIIRDVTESGLALQAVTPLRIGEDLALRFELFSPRVKIETRARVRWADGSGQAGISFDDLSPKVRRALRDWILLQMLTAAAASGRDSIFTPLDSQLVLSAAARPAISLATNAVPEVRWGILSLSVRSFGVFVDTVILLCAVLLFSISAIAVMGGVPPLPLAASLLFAACAIFVAAYQLIFSDFLCGASPGRRLAAEASGTRSDDFLLTRFR